jgi:hypothetical protein
MTEIDDEAFKDAQLPEFPILPSVQWIGPGAFPKTCKLILALGKTQPIFTKWRTEWRQNNNTPFGERPGTAVAASVETPVSGGCCQVL